MRSILKEVFLIALFSLVLVSLWFRNGHILAAAESGMPFYDLHKSSQDYSYAWSDLGLGNYTGTLVATYPTFWVFDKLASLGVKNFIIEAFVFWFILFTAGVGIFLLTKEFFPKIGNRFVFLSVLFYWFNPLSLINVWHRFLINYMFFFAVYPILVYIFARALRERKLFFVFWFSLLSAIFSFAFSSITFVILLWFTLFLFGFIFFLLSRDFEERLFIIKFFLASLISYFLANFWWIVLTLRVAPSSNLSASISKFYSTIGNLDNLTIISRLLGSLADILRFLHVYSYKGGQSWFQFYITSPAVAVEFLITGLILWFLLAGRRLKSVLVLGFVFIISVFLMKGNNPPFGEFFQFFFIKSFVVQLFRNPFEKFGFLMLLVSAPLFSGASAHIFSAINLGVARRAIYLVFVVLLAVFWGFLFWSGDAFKSRLAQDRPQTLSYEVEVPPYYRQASSWLAKYKDESRGVSFPIGPEGSVYNWQFPYKGVDPSYIFFSISNVSNNTVIPYYYDIVKELTNYQLSQKSLTFFPLIASRFLILRSDIDYRSMHVANPDVLRVRIEKWEKGGLITKRFEYGKVGIYELSEKYRWPKIYSTSNYLFSNSPDVSYLDNFEDSSFLSEKAVFLDTQEEMINSFSKPNISIQPDAFFIYDESLSASGLSDDELMSKLFYSKHLPGTINYPFIRFKELLETPPDTDQEGQLIFRLGILGKRSVEIFRLEKKGVDEKLVERTESEFVDQFGKLRRTLEVYIKRDDDVSNLIRNSLIVQAELFKRVGFDKGREKIASFLAEFGIWPSFPLPRIGEESDQNVYLIYRFNTPRDGSYKIRLDKLPINRGFYLNGERVDFDLTHGFYLDKGVHELALPFAKSEIYKNVIALDELKIDDNYKDVMKVDLPDLPSFYKFSFDYKFARGVDFNLRFTQDVDEANFPDYSVLIEKNIDFHDAKHFEQRFTTSPGASSAVITFTPNRWEICDKFGAINFDCKEENKTYKAELKNFKLDEIDFPKVDIFSQTFSPEKTSETKVGFEKINPSLYKLKVSKKDDKKEVLVFSEMFNPDWKAYYQDDSAVPDQNHFIANFFANGWIIDKKGDYEMTLKFSQQRVFEKSLLFSKIFFFLSAVFLGARYFLSGSKIIKK